MIDIQEQIEKHLQELSKYTSTPNKGTTRLTYSQEDLGARTYIKEKMYEYGLKVHEDGFGNIFGKMEGPCRMHLVFSLVPILIRFPMVVIMMDRQEW